MGNALRKEEPHAYSSRDTGRGISNVTVAKNTNPERFTAPAHAYGMEGYREDEAQNDPQYDTVEAHSVRKRFIAQESIGAKTTDLSKPKRAQQKAANDPSYLQEVQNQEQNLARARLIQKRKMYVRGRQAGKAVRMGWMGLSVAGSAFTVQFICGLASAIGIFGQAVMSDFAQNNTLGKFISFFVDIEKLSPLGNIGMLFWGVSSFIALAVFTAFSLWFYMTHTEIMGTTMGTFITIGCLVLSLTPVFNLFPWLIVWIIYTNAHSIFSWSQKV